MADHQRFTLATDIKVYFCDPRSPRQRRSMRMRMDYCGNICPRKSDGESAAKSGPMEESLPRSSVPDLASCS